MSAEIINQIVACERNMPLEVMNVEFLLYVRATMCMSLSQKHDIQLIKKRCESNLVKCYMGNKISVDLSNF